MKNCFVKIFFFFALIVTSASTGFAWDDAGHKLTAYIAWEQMTPEAREAAAKILLSAPEDSDLSVFYMQDSRSVAARQRELFTIAATWADIVRDKKFKLRSSKYHHGKWHYLDTFWREANGKIEIVPELKSDEENALERLYAFDKVLRDAAASDADKAIALAWVLHIGGDIHQPLHDSARVTKYDPKGDQGGNLFMLSPKGAKGEDRLSLHWYWDSIVGRSVPRSNDACDSDYLPAIAQEMMRKYPPAKMNSRLEIGQFDKWQKEGFQIASTKLYPSSLKFGEIPSENYKKMAFEIAQEQIALAGYRLGAMLNQIFGNVTSQQNNEKTRREIEATGSKVGQGANDAWLWYKTRAALATANDLRDAAIAVDVEDSIVTLRGTVVKTQQMVKAIQTVQETEGVKAVKNLLIVSAKSANK